MPGALDEQPIARVSPVIVYKDSNEDLAFIVSEPFLKYQYRRRFCPYKLVYVLGSTFIF